MTRRPAARAGGGSQLLLIAAALAQLLFVPAGFGMGLPAAAVPGRASARVALELVQQLRTGGCDGRPGSPLPLRRPRTLQAAAARWAAGAPLEVAIEDAGYRAERSEALQYRGSAAGLRAALLQRLCRPLRESLYSDLGLRAQDDELWIVLASPFQAPAPQDAAAVATQLLERINAARAQKRRCGSRSYSPAPPLQLDARLSRAAERHARDMLAHDFFDHRGSDGSTPATRVSAAGYRYRQIGENIALGAETVGQAVQGWIASPAHCANIMDGGFVQTGVAFAVNRRGAPRIYWVEDFGTPGY